MARLKQSRPYVSLHTLCCCCGVLSLAPKATAAAVALRIYPSWCWVGDNTDGQRASKTHFYAPWTRESAVKFSTTAPVKQSVVCALALRSCYVSGSSGGGRPVCLPRLILQLYTCANNARKVMSNELWEAKTLTERGRTCRRSSPAPRAHPRRRRQAESRRYRRCR